MATKKIRLSLLYSGMFGCVHTMSLVADEVWLLQDEVGIIVLEVIDYEVEVVDIPVARGQIPITILYAHRAGESGFGFRLAGDNAQICYPDFEE